MRCEREAETATRLQAQVTDALAEAARYKTDITVRTLCAHTNMLTSHSTRMLVHRLNKRCLRRTVCILLVDITARRSRLRCYEIRSAVTTSR